MGSYSFQYITGTLEDGSNVRWGRIDFVELGRAILHYHPNEQEQQQLKAALGAATPYLNRCQHDLLRLEFGEEKKKLDEVDLATDVLEDPAGARTEKLTRALDKIREYF